MKGKRKSKTKSKPKPTKKAKKGKAKSKTKSKSKRSKLRVAKPRKGYQEKALEQTSDEARAAIQERLERIRESLSAIDIDSRARVHSYADESIDGELLVKVPWGTSTDDLVRDIEGAMGRESMRGFWLNMGTRFTIKEDDEVYRRFRGYNDVNTHYQAAVPANWSEIPLIVRKVIVKGMEKKYGRKADSVYVRIHWSPDGSKPRNRG